jgi:hypothetical protein
VCHIVTLSSTLGRGATIHVATRDGAALVAASLRDRFPSMTVVVTRDADTSRHAKGDTLIFGRG